MILVHKSLLDTHSSREAMLLAVTVLGGTICRASVPNFFSRFQVLRLECVKFVFCQFLPIAIFFVHSTTEGDAQLILFHDQY
jgi:hypothetical protein